ncbi:Methylamine utilisation protein MauE [Flavobacterium micromati]|uniref:Methylamine utilisation protein MauE n=1 Tax=Flavobacterium micromati TaxID=229205 RepID=A0A1M5MW26_9FLAO|nr:MauE/DoxX family redox-associated membrane protein [Flavobacterium micromati]SHG81530.1 Methylamine utilisation protein MauE [Flavobacterium micromati]
MKLTATFRNKFTIIISYLFILLFVYSAVSKVLDFQNFQVQLAQSPLLTAFATFISYAVLIVEFSIAVLLSIPKTRTIALYLAFGLMFQFTLYIYIILNYSSFVPCSCGGILENMNWTEHLFFNIAFAMLAIAALYLSNDWQNKPRFYISIRLVAISLLSIVLMAGLFLISEDMVQHRNNFVRRFPPFPAKRITVENLKFNSYYFAGENNGEIFLGNTSAPALITKMDTTLQEITTQNIKIMDTLFKFHNVQLRVLPPYFYLFDGTVPCIFKGNLSDGKAVLQSRKIPGFTKAVVIDSTTLIIRTLSNSRENLLATVNLNKDQIKNSDPKLLVKQIDGLFDTDGTMQYSHKQRKFVYLYYYRNQYTVTDHYLNLVHRGNTIDTTSKAKIKMKYIKAKKQRVFSAPPLLINRVSAMHNNLLFVNSTLPARYDELKMWKNANVIDVYDILTKSYLMSFYIYKIDGEKVDDFIVTDTHLFVILGSNIVSYKLSKALKEQFK